jgi:hypothetical protein
MFFIYPLFLMTTLVSASPILNCDEIRKDPKILLIYETTASQARIDPVADLALWKSFQMKFSEKIPALFGNRTLMNDNQNVRNISQEQKELILKCFHGESFEITRHTENKLENEIPLLDKGDPLKMENLFTQLLQEQKVGEDKQSLAIIEKGLSQIEAINEKGSLACLTDLPGIESKVNPIKRKNFPEMFRSIMCRSGIKPKLGEPHTWNPDFLKGRMNPPFSKLLVALANGDTRRIMPTGFEDKLSDWILKKETRSLSIHEMFEKSYELCDGNIYEAFLTIENVLSENFYLGGPNREKLTISTKLEKIINHTGGEFDLFGPWYHLFGMMLYGFADGSGFKATLMGKVEMGTALFYDEYNDKQESYMIAGGSIGAKLKKQVKRIKTEKDFKKFCEGASQKIESDDYLNLNDKLPKKIKLKKKK